MQITFTNFKFSVFILFFEKYLLFYVFGPFFSFFLAIFYRCKNYKALVQNMHIWGCNLYFLLYIMQWMGGGLALLLYSANYFDELIDILPQLYGSFSGLIYLSVVQACIYSTLNEKQMKQIKNKLIKKKFMKQLGLDQMFVDNLKISNEEFTNLINRNELDINQLMVKFFHSGLDDPRTKKKNNKLREKIYQKLQKLPSNKEFEQKKIFEREMSVQQFSDSKDQNEYETNQLDFFFTNIFTKKEEKEKFKLQLKQYIKNGYYSTITLTKFIFANYNDKQLSHKAFIMMMIIFILTRCYFEYWQFFQLKVYVRGYWYKTIVSYMMWLNAITIHPVIYYMLYNNLQGFNRMIYCLRHHSGIISYKSQQYVWKSKKQILEQPLDFLDTHSLTNYRSWRNIIFNYGYQQTFRAQIINNVILLSIVIQILWVIIQKFAGDDTIWEQSIYPYIIKIIIPFYILPLILFLNLFLYKMAKINGFCRIQQKRLQSIRQKIYTIHQLYFGQNQQKNQSQLIVSQNPFTQQLIDMLFQKNDGDPIKVQNEIKQLLSVYNELIRQLDSDIAKGQLKLMGSIPISSLICAALLRVISEYAKGYIVKSENIKKAELQVKEFPIEIISS